MIHIIIVKYKLSEDFIVISASCFFRLNLVHHQLDRVVPCYMCLECSLRHQLRRRRTRSNAAPELKHGRGSEAKPIIICNCETFSLWTISQSYSWPLHC